MAIELVKLTGGDVDGAKIITSRWTLNKTDVQGSNKVKGGISYLNDELFSVTRKDGETFKVKYKDLINTIAEYFKAQAKDFKSEDTKENITNNLQARYFKTGLTAILRYTGKYGFESSTLPEWRDLLINGKFYLTLGKKVYQFYYLIDENGRKYLEWALTKPAEFYKKHLDAMLDEKTPPDTGTGGDEEETQTYYIYLVLFILAIFLIFRK